MNFIAVTAELLPSMADSFDWVHMRPRVAHVQVPDLTLLKARRVLKPKGKNLGVFLLKGGSGIIP
ncbi:MAG: class I SAM-dependent methyltransferase, partial [Chitinivibrionales bacterium]|nr:class I SAM-dependent methyltransferase [Chitinivibrionales bacterium]